MANWGKICTNIVKCAETSAARGTFLDAFKAFNSKPHMVEKLSKSISASSKDAVTSTKSIFANICEGLGESNTRAKKIIKLKTKIPKVIKELELEEVKTLILNRGMKDVIGDACGTRIIFNNAVKSREELVTRLIKEHKAGKITLHKVENYHGKGINPYFSKKELDRLSELDYVLPSGKREGVEIISKLKSSGYTRVNIDFLVGGARGEFQAGGKFTTKFGEVEHYLYDMRRIGNADLSKLSGKQRELFSLMREEYIKVSKNSGKKIEFEKYLTEVWKILKVAEKSTKIPNLPAVPEGLPKILSAKNLLKLEQGAL